jgi:hypothetical protein
MPDMPVEHAGDEPYPSGMEARLAVLEEIAAATKVALAGFRADMREMRSEIRSDIAALRGEMTSLRNETHTNFDALRREMYAERRALRADYRWLMGMMLAGAGAILAVMAHGFHWY